MIIKTYILYSVTQDMFVQHLKPLIKNLNLFDTHRKLATATYRLLNAATSEQKNDDYKLFGSSEEKYSSSLRFDLCPEAIKALTNDIEKETNCVMDTIAKLADDKLDRNNILVPLIQLDQRLSGIENSVVFLQNVSPTKEIRDASNEAEVQLRKFAVEISMRKDVYKVIKAYSEKCDESKLDPEWKRYLDFMLRDYKRAGLDLDDENYEKIKGIKKKMSEISSEFQKNLNEENTKFIFEEKELDGMTEDWKKARLITDDKDENKGKYDVLAYGSLHYKF